MNPIVNHAFDTRYPQLVGQAALSFRLWTGRMPATAPVLEALRSEPESA